MSLGSALGWFVTAYRRRIFPGNDDPERGIRRLVSGRQPGWDSSFREAGGGAGIRDLRLASGLMVQVVQVRMNL